MKFSIIKHNKNGNYEQCYDGYLNHHWFKVLKNLINFTTNHEEADFSIFPIIYEPNYKYDENINHINFKNIIVLDFLEYGCGVWGDKKYQTSFHHFFGYQHDVEEEWIQSIHKNIKNCLVDKIRIYFKRELSNKLDLSKFNIPFLPADYINTYEEYKPCSEELFWNRGLDLLYIWGRSSQDRVKFHSSVFSQMDKFGHNMYTSEKQYDEELINNKRDNAILLLHREWYERVDFMKYQSNSRSVVDLYGSGLKCFRTIESTINSVSFKQDPSFLTHTYPWIDNYNCIFLPNRLDSNNLDESKACDVVLHYLRGGGRQYLYNIYLKSCETNLKYRGVTYLNEYFIPCITKNIK